MGHGEMILSARFSVGGQLLLTGSSDSKAKLWDVKTGNAFTPFWAIPIQSDRSLLLLMGNWCSQALQIVRQSFGHFILRMILMTMGQVSLPLMEGEPL